jgi:hypothetical protein
LTLDKLILQEAARLPALSRCEHCHSADHLAQKLDPLARKISRQE